MDCVCTLTDGQEYILQGKRVIKDIEQLYTIIVDTNLRNIHIKDDFFERYFTEISIVEFTESLSMNPNIYVTFDKKHESQYSLKVKTLSGLNTLDKIVDFFLFNGEDGVDLMQVLCKNYIQGHNESVRASSKLSTAQLELLESHNKMSQMQAMIEKQEDRNKELETKLDTLIKRINYSYNKNIDVDKMDFVNIETPMYKKILYIKEITRVHYTDSFLYYLREILKSLYGIPARFLVLESPYAFKRSYMYPDCVPHTSLTYKDVYSSNIYSTGFQHKLVEDILANAYGLEYLIVLDRSGSDHVHIQGEGVEILFTVSDLKDLADDLHLSRVISYSQDTLFIPFVKDFDEMNPAEKLSKYSSMDITKAIIQLLER